MLKPLAFITLFALSVAAEPALFQTSELQVTFPGSFQEHHKVASYIGPNLSFYALRWNTSLRQGSELLANLQRQLPRRGAQMSFVQSGGVEGLQFREELGPRNTTWTRYFLVAGQCYEFRASTADQGEHAEVHAFFDSIRFRHKPPVNLEMSLSMAGRVKPVLKYVYGEPACVDNIKHIYNSCLIYASNHGGAYPNNLSELNLSTTQLCCPKSGRADYVFSHSAHGLVVYCRGEAHRSEGYPANYPRVTGRALVPINPPLAPPPSPAVPYTF